MDKKKLLLLLAGGGTITPPLTFITTVVITSNSPLNPSISTSSTGILLANSDLSKQLKRLESESIYGVHQVDKRIYALSRTKLHVSEDYGEVFTTYDLNSFPVLSITGGNCLTVVGSHILLSGDNGLFSSSIDINTFTKIASAPLYSMMKASDGRLFLAKDGTDGVDYSDDWGLTRIACTLDAGTTAPICTVKPMGGNLVYAWNGVAQVSTDNGVTFTTLTNFPVGASYVDFELLPSGRLVVTHDVNGVYYTDDLTSIAVFTLAISTTPRNVQRLTDRVIVNVDNGAYYSLNNAIDWTFDSTHILGAGTGSMFVDDFTYLVEDSSADLLYNEITEDFLIE